MVGRLQTSQGMVVKMKKGLYIYQRYDKLTWFDNDDLYFMHILSK